MELSNCAEYDRLSTSRNALILYGSETGNAQDVAEELGRLTTKLHFQSVVIDLDSIELRDVLRYTIVIFVVSTTGQGEFPQNARSFWSTICSTALKGRVLRKLHFTTFGLGDSSYPRYNVAQRMLHGRLLQLGANLICERGEGNEQHPEGHSAGVRLWMAECRKALLEKYPLADSMQPLSDDFFIEPLWKLESIDKVEDITSIDHSPLIKDETTESTKLDELPSTSLMPVVKGKTARITRNERVTTETHFQDVRLLDLSLDHVHDYGPGAVAEVYAKNFPEDVNQFIQLMKWEDMADKPLRLIATRDMTHAGIAPPSPLQHLDTDRYKLTLRWLLENVLDIMSIPRRSFFAQLVQFAGEESEDEIYQKQRLVELADPALIDELWDYTTRPKRTILEVMMDFTLLKIPWQYALALIPIMRPRQFSIASGGKLKYTESGNTRVQLLVAIVDPPSPIIKWRRRYGVCTRYISSLRSGQDITISLRPGYLNVVPAELKVPIIMIGPGTGVAPMRSMICQRLAWSESQVPAVDRPLARDMLFFGCRTATDDQFFEGEWKIIVDHGLQVFTAFSRDTSHPKQYVQDKIKANAVVIAQRLIDDDAKVYVCGSSGNMPKGVREALVDALATHADLKSRSDAEQYLENMERDGRYKQETW